MLPGCQGGSESPGHYLVRLGVNVFEAWMTAHMMYSTGIVACFVFSVGIVFILNFLRVLESYITTDLADHTDCIRLYRVVQILEKSLNAYLSERILPAIMIGDPTVEIFGLFVCISLSKETPMPGFLIFPLMTTVTGINNVVIVALASKFHSASERLLVCWERASLSNKWNNKLRRRDLRACNVLKIKFGSNFVEKGTPLVLQDFCINQTISLILLNRERK
ncbi:uncharacterized protein LOC118437166 isoform X1 [Folsomia candida]|uniref:uncharacterized protein LOC118437166 isoform X1 n=2 Tax=Folsomia candida TaxID=158441 RepID=UPI001604B911|nr:uncharacterized protein LOC118437166 isoform X1 [Folsomia candida]